MIKNQATFSNVFISSFTNMYKVLSKNFDIAHLRRFICLFVPIYYINHFVLSITDPGYLQNMSSNLKGSRELIGPLSEYVNKLKLSIYPHYYSPFIDNYLNYISWIDSSILYTSNLIVHAFGLHSFVIGKVIKIPAGASVWLWPPCTGLGIMSFWIAFVFSHRLHWKIKLFWSLTGIVIIWFVNCWRIALLLMSLQNKWKTFKFIDHHEMFNIAAYSVILLLIYFFSKRSRKEMSYN